VANLDRLEEQMMMEVRQYAVDNALIPPAEFNVGLLEILNRYRSLVATEYERVNSEISGIYQNGKPKWCLDDHFKDTLKVYEVSLDFIDQVLLIYNRRT
jgi:hypothetical protein